MKWNNCEYFYIGKSKRLSYRYKQHLNSFINGVYKETKLYPIYIEFGLPTFEVLKYCEENDLTKFENEYLKLHNCNEFILNTIFKNDKETKGEYFTVRFRVNQYWYSLFDKAAKIGISQKAVMQEIFAKSSDKQITVFNKENNKSITLPKGFLVKKEKK